MCLLKASWAAYSFSQNCDQNCKIFDALVLFNFFYRIACYFSCGISESTAPLCLKLCTEVACFVFFPTPQVRAELVSPIGTYANFPKVMYFKTVQHNELVRTATCHCFTFRVLKLLPQKVQSVPYLQHLVKFSLDLPSPRYSNSP